MTNDEILAAVTGLPPEARAKLMADIDAVHTTVVLDLTFTKHGNDWLCVQCEHDILISSYSGQYTVYVHQRDEQATVVAGPFSAKNFSFCVAWAKGRCGLLPDQVLQLQDTMTSLQHAELRQLLEALAKAEETSHAEFRKAYDTLGEWCTKTFGEEFWEDHTIHTLRTLVGL